MKKYKVGYTQGVYDMFHSGHLNLLIRAKEYCDYLIVGVNSDSLVEEYKHKTPVINELNRKYIVEHIKEVDQCIIMYTLDKVQSCRELKYDVIFIGDDWKGSARWEQTEADLAQLGTDVVYLPYTEGICSSGLRLVEENRVSD